MTTKIRVLEEEHAVQEILAALGGKRIIRINGHSGHGKTRLAKALSAAIGWQRVSLDDYLGEPKTGLTIVDRVDNQRMLKDIEGALGAGGVVIEGVLIDKVIPVGAHGELKIYMLSLFSPEWADDEKRRARQLGTDVYHREFRPEFWADIKVLKAVD